MSHFGLGFIASSGGNDQFTKSLLHFDGTNGSTTITDTAFGLGTNLVWTAVSSSLSTAAQKFGTASLLTGTSAYATTPDNAAFNALGTTPFVFDFWINTANNGSQMFMAGIGFRSGTFSFYLVRNAANTISFVTPSGTVTTAGTVSSAGWHHVAAVADGSNIYIALDGAVSAGVGYTSLPATAGPFDIGNVHFLSPNFISNGFIGNIDEARLSIGTTRGWTSNFTPPSGAYFQ
jgi:hypothetical protein